MVAGLGPVFDQSELPLRIMRGILQHEPELLFAHVMRAGTAHKESFRPDQPQRADIDLLVSRERLRNRLLRSRERRRIENDKAELAAGPLDSAQFLEGITLAILAPSLDFVP